MDLNVQKFAFTCSKFSKWWKVRCKEKKGGREENVYKKYLFFFFFFFLLWSGSGTSRKVISALSSRAYVTSRLITVSICFLWSLFVLTGSVHKISSFYLSQLAPNSSLHNPSHFWCDRFPLAILILIFIFSWLLTGWVHGANAQRRVYAFLCGSRRVNIRLGVLLFIHKSPNINGKDLNHTNMSGYDMRSSPPPVVNDSSSHSDYNEKQMALLFKSSQFLSDIESQRRNSFHLVPLNFFRNPIFFLKWLIQYIHAWKITKWSDYSKYLLIFRVFWV